MVLKIIGCLTIIASTTVLGLIKSHEMKSRIAELEDMKNTLTQIENEIKFTKTPLTQIFEKVSASIKSPVRYIFENTITILNSESGIPLCVAWENAIKMSEYKLSLKKDDIEKIVFFGKCLGSSDIEGEVKNITLLKENLLTQISKAVKINEKNNKLYTGLGLYSGLIISILLF